MTAETLPAPAWLTVAIWTPQLAPGASGTVRLPIPHTVAGDPIVLYRPAELPAAITVDGLTDGKLAPLVAEDGTISVTFTNSSSQPVPSRPYVWRVATIAAGEDSAVWDDAEDGAP